MRFDEIIDRRDTHSMKWDMMEARYGVSPEDGLAMWVADMDFRPPDCIREAVGRMNDHGVFGYYGDEGAYRAAIAWWMETRHGWDIDPGHLFTVHGLVNGTAICIDTFTEPGDAVVLFTPVYHAFARVLNAAGREVRELPLTVEAGKYVLDWDRYDALMTGAETMLIWCSPHNPGGRVWTREEQARVAEFAARHDLILVSDEIHHDLVYPGHSHLPMARIEGTAERLVTMTAPSKTFNIAGTHTGNVHIADGALRRRFGARLKALGLSPNSFGLAMTEAAYSPQGAAWVDDLMRYLDGNRQSFDGAIAAIPGAVSMPLEATFLSWVDFSGTGLPHEKVSSRVEEAARICVNHGPTFGTGGAGFLRFNIGMPRSQVEEAGARLEDAFADLR